MREGHQDGCDGVQLSRHTIFERVTNAYRVIERCRCGVVRRLGSMTFARYADASAAENLPGEEVFLPSPPKPKRKRGRKAAPPPPTSAEINAIWLQWWRGLMKSVGHESRL